MTIQEIHNRIRLLYDQFDSNQYANFEDVELDDLINQTVVSYVKTRYTGNNYLRASAEEIQKRIDDLRLLIQQSTIGSPVVSAGYTNADQYTLPADYWFLLNAKAKVSFTDNCGNALTVDSPVKMVTHDESGFDSDSSNPFKRPANKYVNGIMHDNFLVILHGPNVSTTEVQIAYIQEPTPVNLATNTTIPLADHTHEEIVELTVARMLEIAESRRVQTHPMQENKIE